MTSVRVIAVTKPVAEDIKDYDLAEYIAYVARISNPANQHNNQTSQKLLNYLIRNAHWSPFEMASVVMEINTTRDIARQILRHRSFSFQEFSQRYAEVDTDDFVVREARLQDDKNRQNSLALDQDAHAAKEWLAMQEEVARLSAATYEKALALGIAKEQARAVLPEGLTPSRLYMSGSLRSWLHYIDLRVGNGTQKEHQLVAQACAEELYKLYNPTEG